MLNDSSDSLTYQPLLIRPEAQNPQQLRGQLLIVWPKHKDTGRRQRSSYSGINDADLADGSINRKHDVCLAKSSLIGLNRSRPDPSPFQFFSNRSRRRRKIANSNNAFALESLFISYV
jgi:hypothetical protein